MKSVQDAFGVVTSTLEAFEAFQEAIRVEETPIAPLTSASSSQPSSDFLDLAQEWMLIRKGMSEQNQVQEQIGSQVSQILKEVETVREQTPPDPSSDSSLDQILEEIKKTRDCLQPQLSNEPVAEITQNELDEKLLFGTLLPTLDHLDVSIRRWKEIPTSSSQEARPYGAEEATQHLQQVLENGVSNLESLRTRIHQWLEQYGVSGYDVVGEAFDPAKMVAVKHHQVSNGEEENRVHTELLRGYSWKGTVLRASEVVVTAYRVEL